jgi:5-methylcytosine-specific restriction protein B
MSTFTWIPFYKELAGRLMDYREQQSELIATLKELKDQGRPVIRLTEKDDSVPLTVMDPFTFFASFNRHATDQNRRAILTAIKNRLQLQAEVPTDFDGIPIMDPRMSWFFPWQSKRKPDDIGALWSFAEAIVGHAPENVAPELFNRCIEVRCVSVTNLTMGMFWMRPDTYIALDSRNRELLDARGIPHDVRDWASYLQFLKAARSRLRETPYEFSHTAYVGEPDRRYWVFQGNPAYYDVVGALRDGEVKTWQVNQHKKDIHTGDTVIIWVTGDTPGCYALATVMSEVRAFEEDPKEASYRKQAAKTTVMEGVTLRIDTNLCDRPVSKADIAGNPTFSDFSVGVQGTNLAATKAHYDGILALAERRKKARYWIYAPGERARLWDDFRRDGVMGFGWDKINQDLSKLKTNEDILSVNRRAYGAQGTDADGKMLCDFVNLVRKGDRVFVKNGRREIVGYGVVTSDYFFDGQQDEYRHRRKATWLACGNWPLTKTMRSLPVKTLTEIRDPQRLQELRALVGATSVDSIPTDNRFNLPSLNIILYGPPGTGKTWTLRNEYMQGFTEGDVNRYEFTTFHQSYSYEDFVEGIKPVMSEEVPNTLAYEVKPGIFKTMVQRALADPNHKYAIFIDEISRGNIASIFGELITLIEEDKRKGEPNELRARLPYSREEFVVPKNLYIIGAMNTADRSVEALDTALRRRFTFVAIPPQPELIQPPDSLDVDLRKLLGVINARIEKLLDKDHCIGHSYFMGIARKSDPLAELRHVVGTKILPLLEEYFYGDPAKIGMVLGEHFVRRVDEAISWAKGEWGMALDEFDGRQVFRIADPVKEEFKDVDFQSVYESV